MPFNEGTIAGTVAWAHDVSRQLGLDVKKLEDDVLVAYGKVVRFLGNGCFTAEYFNISLKHSLIP
jgi:hypothetical protein